MDGLLSKERVVSFIRVFAFFEVFAFKCLLNFSFPILENIRPRGYQNMDSASTKTTQVETSMWTWIFSAYSLLYGYVTAF